MRLGALIFCTSSVTLAFLNCKPPRKHFRIAKAAILRCDKQEKSCIVDCKFGVRDGHPSTITCENKKWNFPQKTQIFCNPTAVAPTAAKTTTSTTTSTTMQATTSTTTTAKITTTTPDENSYFTDCGDVRKKYLLPVGTKVNCQPNRCFLECPNNAKAIPSAMKCFAAKNKWKPRPFSKIMCVGGSVGANTANQDKPNLGNAVVQTLSGGQQGSVIGNGFNGKNTMTDCGDMKKKGIKLAFGVDFECEPTGCKYNCHNPFEIPNIKEVKCRRKGKKKILVPKRAEIKCFDPMLSAMQAVSAA